MSWVKSYGYEIEWGDIDRSVDIPEHLGSWEGPKLPNGYYAGAECDVINSDGSLCDPLAETTTKGGEINVAPATTIEGIVDNIMQIKALFKEEPFCGFVNHGHVHVYCPEIDMRKFERYIEDNERQLIKLCYDVRVAQALEECVDRETYEYVMYDGGRINSFDGRKTLHWDTYKESKSSRAAVNLSNLNKGKTIEFRCFRASADESELTNSFKVCEMFVNESQKRIPRDITTLLLEEGIAHNLPKMDFSVIEPNFTDKRHKKERGNDYKYRADNKNIWRDISAK